MESAPSFTTGRCSPAPTARMQPCGGLMTAAKSLMPNMPRLETEKVPPWYSSGFSLPSRARPARSFISLAMVARPLVRSEEHTSELQSLMRISYAVFCLIKKDELIHNTYIYTEHIT